MTPISAQLAPGAYVAPVRPEDAEAVPLSTDVAGFAGIAARGPVGEPVALESWRGFEARFGGLAGPGHLPAVVRGFFDSGGRRCVVVRVASGDEHGRAAEARLEHLVDPPGPEPPSATGWAILASSPGSWGNELRARLVRRNPVETLVDVSGPSGDWSGLEATGSLARGMLVELAQEGSPTLRRIVSHVDAVRGRVYWVNEDPELRLGFEAPVEAFDPENPVLATAVEYSLVVTRGGVPLALHEGLAPVPSHLRYGPSVLAAIDSPVRIEELRAAAGDPAVLPHEVEGALAGGRDGVTLLEPGDWRAAHAVLAEVEEVALMASPDAHVRPLPVTLHRPPPPEPERCCPPHPEPRAEPLLRAAGEAPPELTPEQVLGIQADLVQHCEERRDRMALLEPPEGVGLADSIAWRERFDSSLAAVYHPWLRSLGRSLPPSGHVAALYARSELDVGVHRAPANSPPLSGLDDVVAAIGEDVHGRLNERGVNVIRALPSRGLRVLGARTATHDPMFRFVPVRRMVIHVRRACERALQWCVFEPNDAATRVKVHLTLTSYLGALWQRGSLAGASAEEAFLVRTDETLNTPADRDAGRLIAEVGIAPLIPYEFVLVRVWRVGDALETFDAGVKARAAA